MDNPKYMASPSVRALADRLSVDLAVVARTTGRTRIAREDVESHVANLISRTDHMPASLVESTASDKDKRYWTVDHAAFGPIADESMSPFMRVASDTLMAANRMIPQVTHHDRADLRAINILRAQLKDDSNARGIKLTTLAFHVKALSMCLEEFPQFNASISANGENVILKYYCHIGIAVDTSHGLMVPVIRDADKKGLWQIATDIADLASRAQDRKIKPHEMGGASMTISNLGGIGGIAFSPIVNPPELAILGITRTETVPIWEYDNWVPVPMAPLDLSYDHRVINGATAARFLVRLAALLAEPRDMLV